MRSLTSSLSSSIWLLLVFTLVSVAPYPTHACEDYAEPLHTSSTVAFSNAPGVAGQGNRAYVAAGAQGVVVLDITNPASPQTVGTIDYAHPIVETWCSSSRLLVLDDLNQLHVEALPLSKASSAASSLQLSFDIEDMVVIGYYVYIAWSDPENSNVGGLDILDVSVPSSPVIVGSLSTGGPALRVDVSGSMAGLLTYDTFRVVNISSPESPTQLGSLSFFESMTDVVLDGDRAYLSEFLLGIKIVDISDPTTPQWDGDFWMPESIFRFLSMAGDHLLVTTQGVDGIAHVYALDPDAVGTTPQVAVTVTPGDPEQFVVVNGTLLMACGADGVTLAVFDPTALPANVGSVATGSAVLGIAARRDHAYAVLGNQTLQIVDVSVPSAPQLAGSVSLQDQGGAVAVTGTHAFVTVGDDGLIVVDISDPDQPSLAGTVTPSGGAFDICIAGRYGYVASGAGGLQVIDVSGTTAWPVVGSASTLQEVTLVKCTGDLAVLASSLLLEVVDVTDPESPAYQGWADLTMTTVTRGLGAEGDHAYVLHSGIHAWLEYFIEGIDLSDPTSPQELGRVPIPGFGGDLVVSGDHGYMESSYSGLLVNDLATPATPLAIGSIATPGDAICVAKAHDSYVYLGTTTHVVVVWKQCGDVAAVDPDASVIPAVPEVTIWPNPFNPSTTVSFALEREQQVRLGIYDLTGRRITVLADKIFGVDRHTLTWEGRDAHGRAVPSGTYVVRLKSVSGVEARKITLVR